MCRELSALRQSIVCYGNQFDARSLTPGQAGDVVHLCAQIEATVASIRALAAARSAEGSDWQHDGYRSPADQLAHVTGTSPGTAKRTLEAGRRMAEQPEVAAAALAGDLSLEQASAVADGVATDPTKAKELIDKARAVSLPELNEEVARVKAAATDPDERRRTRHAQRSFRRWTDRDGAMQARLYGHPEDGAGLWRMLDPIRRRLNVLRRESGASNETLDALDYDAVMAMASIAVGRDAELSLADLLQLGLFPQLDASLLSVRDADPGIKSPAREPDLFSSVDPRPPSSTTDLDAGAATKGRRVKKLAGSPLRVMIRVDLDALLRGVPIEGELCEIAGFGPVPVQVVKDLLATEDPFIIGILTRGEALTGVYHHGRHPNAHQRSALDFLYPTCAVTGCSSKAGLQYDHRLDFADTRITAFDLLDRLCGHHHRKKTHQGWALVDGRGKRAFVPPGDPRHPLSRPATTATGPAP